MQVFISDARVINETNTRPAVGDYAVRDYCADQILFISEDFDKASEAQREIEEEFGIETWIVEIVED